MDGSWDHGDEKYVTWNTRSVDLIITTNNTPVQNLKKNEWDIHLIWSGEKYLSSGIKYKSAAGAGVMVQTTVQGGGGNPKNVGYFPSNGLCFLLMLEGGKEGTLSQLSLLTRILYFFFFYPEISPHSPLRWVVLGQGQAAINEMRP